jgi:hypothetical protein
LPLAVHAVAMRAIEGWYRAQGKALGIEDGRTGSITVVQRFGSDLALNVHFHVLGLDGVYDLAGHFTPIAAPSIGQMEQLCTTIAGEVSARARPATGERNTSAGTALREANREESAPQLAELAAGGGGYASSPAGTSASC